MLTHRVLAVVLAVLVLPASLVAQADQQKAAPAAVQFTEEKISQIEDNLVLDLESANTGVVIGGTQTVREMKRAVPGHDFSKLIIPLMRIVKDEDGDRAARILAALALHEIDAERGNFAISREAEMSKDEVFRSLCANLARMREAEKKK